MPLAKWVEVNIVDPLTQGRHSLIRETALELVRLHDGAVNVSSSKPTLSSGPPGQSPPLHLSNLPTDPRAGTIPTQVLASLHFFPPLLLALSSLTHIKMQKIDMGSLIKTPNELFVSEEEWFGKGIKERKAKAKSQSGAAEGNEDKMSVDESATTAAGVGVDLLAVKEDPDKPRATEYEMEGPEELSEVLDYVAGIIVELDKRTGIKRNLESEDPLTRNLRLNLLALAKRAPLDTIARLPMDLVPEHIRHFVPTLTT
jgi:bromodomain-containing protein 7